VVKGLALLAAAMVVAPSLHAQDDERLARIEAMLERPSVMCGAFEQRKSLTGLSREVRSTGRVCVVADRGVLWNTRQPFPSSLLLTREEIVESSGGRVTQRMSAHQEPTVGIISELLFSVLSGDFAKLRSTFAIKPSVEPQRWEATLTPRAKGLRAIMRRIELSGGGFVREVTIVEPSGDRTAIAFSGMTTGESALLPDEARALARDARPGAGPP